MRTNQNIYLQIARNLKAITNGLVSLCNDQMLWSFYHSNEPKLGTSWSGYIINS